MTNESIRKFHMVCRAIARSDCPDEFAKAYARAGQTILDPDEAHTHSLYILSNMRHWRGIDAQAMKAALKETMRELSPTAH